MHTLFIRKCYYISGPNNQLNDKGVFWFLIWTVQLWKIESTSATVHRHTNYPLLKLNAGTTGKLTFGLWGALCGLQSTKADGWGVQNHKLLLRFWKWSALNSMTHGPLDKIRQDMTCHVQEVQGTEMGRKKGQRQSGAPHSFLQSAQFPSLRSTFSCPLDILHYPLLPDVPFVWKVSVRSLAITTKRWISLDCWDDQRLTHR